MSSKSFSVRRALDNDFNLTATLIVPFVVWAVYLLSLVIAGGSQVILILAVIATAASPVLIYLRLRKLRVFFENGVEITGELTRVYFYQDRGRIDFRYNYTDKKFSGSAAIHKNDLTRSFEVGQSVPLIVDPDHPERALMPDLYS